MTISVTTAGGWKRLKGWDGKGPNVIKGPHNTWELPSKRWIDHSYRLRKNGRTVYVSEPYGMYEDAIEELFLLMACGWNVNVTGESEYYPGWTIKIEVWWGDAEIE